MIVGWEKLLLRGTLAAVGRVLRIQLPAAVALVLIIGLVRAGRALVGVLLVGGVIAWGGHAGGLSPRPCRRSIRQGSWAAGQNHIDDRS